MWGKGAVIHCWWEGKWQSHLGSQFADFLQNETYSSHSSSNHAPSEVKI
jgi:hypothetical protein